MIKPNAKVQALIKKACKRKKHIKLTVGTYYEGEKMIRVYDKTGEVSNENYTYAIGSVTKPFVGSLLAKYVYEGKMSLDDPISKYIDGLDPSAYYPNLRRLATHTSGYPKHMGWNILRALSNEFALEFGLGGGKTPCKLDFYKMKSLVEKNKREDKDYPWKYANINFALLGYAIGIVSGHGYWDTMDDFLSNELGLTGSYTGVRAQNLHGYTWLNKDIGNWFTEKDFMAPCGDISSTADDLLTFAKINMYQEKPYLSLSHKKHANVKENHHMGIGWILQKNEQVLMHTGQTSRLLACLGIDMKQKFAVVVLINHDCENEIQQIGAVLYEQLAYK